MGNRTQHKIDKLFTEFSMYQRIPLLNQDYTSTFEALVNENYLMVDLFCIHCGKERLFKVFNGDFSQLRNGSKDLEIFDISLFLSEKNYYLNFLCTSGEIHRYSLILKYEQDEDHFIKIGQYPSLADLEKHTAEKYKKLLGKDYSNLNRAIGLNSHGIGAGAYVYLRRIFENLIEEKHQESLVDDASWDEVTYAKSRMSDKIDMLKDKLPSLFKESTNIYGILSKGVHELSEEQCLEYFPVLRFAIELILDEKLEAAEKQAKRETLLKSLNSIATEIS